MDESVFVLRDFVDTDFEAFASLWRAFRPDTPLSAKSLRQFDHAYPKDKMHRRYAVARREGNEVVGVGQIGEEPFQPHNGMYWVFACVRPECQRQGIGTRLFELLLEEALRSHADGLRAAVEEGAIAGRTFLEKRGFKERRRSWESVLELASADTGQLNSVLERLGKLGIEISTLSQEGPADPSVIDRLYRLDAETGADVPRMDPWVPWTLEAFRASEIENPNALPDARFIAKHLGQYVAMTNATKETADPESLIQGYTCTRREYRRKGLAFALKLCIIDYARKNGYRRILTNNDSANTPMWTLNERLGFRRRNAWIQSEKRISRDTG